MIKDKTNFYITHCFNVVGVLHSFIFKVLSGILIYLVELYCLTMAPTLQFSAVGSSVCSNYVLAIYFI